MGAHEYLDVTCGEVFQDVFALLALHDTCEEFHSDVYIFQEVTEGLEVLLGENFRRSHQAGLETIVEGDEHGHQCHEGLARTDITLQEAVHLATAAHVGTYLVHHSLLCPRQLEGEVVGIEAVEDVADAIEDIASILAPLVARIP